MVASLYLNSNPFAIPTCPPGSTYRFSTGNGYPAHAVESRDAHTWVSFRTTMSCCDSCSTLAAGMPSSTRATRRNRGSRSAASTSNRRTPHRPLRLPKRRRFPYAACGSTFRITQGLHSDNRFAGHDIGRPIVKRIIERHGARLWTQSGVDVGATLPPTLRPDTQALGALAFDTSSASRSASTTEREGGHEPERVLTFVAIASSFFTRTSETSLQRGDIPFGIRCARNGCELRHKSCWADTMHHGKPCLH